MRARSAESGKVRAAGKQKVSRRSKTIDHSRMPAVIAGERWVKNEGEDAVINSEKSP
jgi:hypothetical protein